MLSWLSSASSSSGLLPCGAFTIHDQLVVALIRHPTAATPSCSPPSRLGDPLPQPHGAELDEAIVGEARRLHGHVEEMVQKKTEQERLLVWKDAARSVSLRVHTNGDDDEAVQFGSTRNSSHSVRASIDILELNCLRRGLLLDAYIWDQRPCYLDALLKTDSHVSNPSNPSILLDVRLKNWKDDLLEGDTKISTHFSNSSGSPRKSLLYTESCLNHTQPMSETNLQIDLVDHRVDDVEDLDNVFSRFDGEKERTITKGSIDMEPIERLPSLAYNNCFFLDETFEEITHDMATTVADAVEILE
ncbi:hypothetical protein GUJ93_ZPchr0006g45589 [Zizania palustris]|uniref:Uncharacterized protein n=1 Tax=Zizania palustris TaxID=103762 RepID=A0A8J5T2C1_ZIZPA|nr:hypothetical protein GUJ93_ZPchr0006g45589 [Zizania palustris]